eukprot:TRINITY_DN10825_c0_g1_i3.p3 TRINITY_DN10825_c0_g1~~TRINITY_DN10825_c0_g1_i3.p3  ORF type:complete len:161 (-),score=34.29 TRINITY_DN10825_c0_g1_i3:235-717(-)
MECFQYFQHILKGFPSDTYLNEYEHKALLDLLEKGHHDPQSKIGCGVKGFMISKSDYEQGFCFHVVQKNDEIIDFSYIKCLKGLFPNLQPPKGNWERGRGGRGPGGRQGRDNRGRRGDWRGGWGRGKGMGRGRGGGRGREGQQNRRRGNGGRQGGRRGRE